MKTMHKHLLGFFFALISSSAMAFNECETHQPCQLDQTCACTVPAYSNYDRHYYFDYQVTKGHVYQCRLDDNLRHIMGELGISTFPAGAKLESFSKTGHTPLTFTVDTSAQEQTTDRMIIKYFVPGSDMPTEVNAACTTLA